MGTNRSINASAGGTNRSRNQFETMATFDQDMTFDSDETFDMEGEPGGTNEGTNRSINASAGGTNRTRN